MFLSTSKVTVRFRRNGQRREEGKEKVMRPQLGILRNLLLNSVKGGTYRDSSRDCAIFKEEWAP
jgi:hypothetical protein